MTLNFDWIWPLNYILGVFLSVAALRWGGGPERWCAAGIVFMLPADRLYHLIFGEGSSYRTVDVGHFIIDAIAAVVLFTTALRANRRYPLWLAALQMLSLTSHFARMASETMGLVAYGLLGFSPFYLQIAILLIGIELHRRRSLIRPRYPAWLNVSFKSEKVGRPVLHVRD